jgi:hypothetical protein
MEVFFPEGVACPMATNSGRFGDPHLMLKQLILKSFLNLTSIG